VSLVIVEALMKPEGLSIIIPVKPPEPYLPILVENVHANLRNIPHEILVQTELGLTNAVIAGVSKSQYLIIAVMDADGSHNPRELPIMYQKLAEGYDLVVGSRYCQKSKNNDSYARQIISLLSVKLTRFLLNPPVSDPMTGYIVGKKEVFTRLQPHLGYKFLLQLLSTAPPPKVYEQPITFLRRTSGKSKMTFRQGLLTFRQILTIYYKSHRRKKEGCDKTY
jgi:glycosyltransferase involved in cell wall biosynthesis